MYKDLFRKDRSSASRKPFVGRAVKSVRERAGTCKGTIGLCHGVLLQDHQQRLTLSQHVSLIKSTSNNKSAQELRSIAHVFLQSRMSLSDYDVMDSIKPTVSAPWLKRFGEKKMHRYGEAMGEDNQVE